MAIVTPTPTDITGCLLYQRLASADKSNGSLQGQLASFVNAASPLLDLVVAGPFREYTLHSPIHARKLAHLCEFVVAPPTLVILSPLEVTVIIMACYLHDLGMSLTSKERAATLSDAAFLDEVGRWPQLLHDIQRTRALQTVAAENERGALDIRLFQLQEAALAAYLRPRHATRDRYVSLIEQLKDATGRRDLFFNGGASFEEELITICESHNSDAGALLETIDAYTDRFPRSAAIGGMRLNVQFCAALLRVVDILDFDRERTPRVLFESLGIADSDLPGSGVSLREWNKHMAVHTIEIDESEIVVSAESTHPAIERSIREFCAIIEREVRDTLAVLRRNPHGVVSQYQLQVPVSVRARVKSTGYTYKDLSFQLDQSAISNLLMGEVLYAEPAVCVRELIQNAVDACRVRALIDRDQSYEPMVSVSSMEEEDERIWIEVSDNGVGMDEHVLSEYFFRIGSSYYASAEFERLTERSGSSFVPISRFGIGVLSVFMVADRLEVLTQNRFSPRGDTVHRTLRVDSRFGLAFVVESGAGRQGTTIRIRLSVGGGSQQAAKFFVSRAGAFLRDAVRRPAVPVSVALPPFMYILGSGTFIGLGSEAQQELDQVGIEPVVLDVGRWSDRISGRVILFLFRVEGGGLSNRRAGATFKMEEMRRFLRNYRGNRITVNGMSMALKKVGKVLGQKESRFIGAIDIEVTGDSKIAFDVSRRRLIGAGASTVRTGLRSAIIAGLYDLGIIARLIPEARAALRSPVTPSSRKPPLKPITDEQVLQQVLAALPSESWPIGLHLSISDRLSLPSGVVYRAISTLIEAGRVVKPESRSLPDGGGFDEAS